MKSYPRARFGAAVAVAFVCGLVFASGLDLTKFGWAQGRVTQGVQVPAPAVASLAETQNAFEAIVDRVKPAVVSIDVARFAQETAQRGQGQGQAPGRRGGGGTPPQNVPPGLEDFFRQFGDGQIPDNRPRQGSGSGFLVSRDGYILTNNHVVADMDRVTVTTVDKRAYAAKVIGRDPTTDVAVIKIEGNNFPFISLGDESTARVGQWVLAIGNPLDLDFTVTAGIISAKNRQVNLPGRSDYSITDFIQTDAAINPGNSGGPLVNIRGEVIGINSAIASGTGYYSGYGFAIPVGLARTVMNDLIEHGEVRRAIVGVSLLEVDPEDAEAAGMTEIRGAKVAGFSTEDSPAKKAGIDIGDVIIAVDGKRVDQVNSLQRIIRNYRVGQTVRLEVMRFGQRREFSIKLTEAKPLAAAPVAELREPDSEGVDEVVASKRVEKIGLSVSSIPSGLSRQVSIPAEARDGLLVREVFQRGPAFQKVFTNEIIDEVLFPVRQNVRSVADFEKALSGVRSGQVITLRIFSPDGRGGTVRTQSIRIP